MCCFRIYDISESSDEKSEESDKESNEDDDNKVTKVVPGMLSVTVTVVCINAAE